MIKGIAGYELNYTICANTFLERVGRATTMQSILGMSAPSVRIAIKMSAGDYIQKMFWT